MGGFTSDTSFSVYKKCRRALSTLQESPRLILVSLDGTSFRVYKKPRLWLFATLAQLVEQRIRNAQVGSSTLPGGSNYSRQTFGFSRRAAF